MIIPKLYGQIEEYEGRKYLNIALTGINNDFLNEYEKMWDGILEQFKKINDCAYISEKDYYKIKVGSVKCDYDKDNIDLPLARFNRLFLESYLDECLYEDYWSEH